ncbi:MAG: succinylglutamate desuccinylase/aspartoacylase family protein [Pyrinomonadaceae bacterium]|nr:succinylglutamate desuccinylase/aspartoacylase family protein [Pyrinomonadaceae bacterium]
MKILTEEIKCGKSTFIKLKAASLYTRTEIEIPVIVERAKLDGPTLLVLGGIHGDEVNGIEIVRRLIFDKQAKPHRGTIICIPVVNVMAFLNLERKFADGRDLNRSFPGNKKGSLAAQVANSITQEIIQQVDYVVDLHTGGAAKFNFPQIRYDGEHPENLMLAKKFNAPFTFLQNKAPVGSLRKVLNTRKIPVVIFEGGRSREIDEDVVKIGVRGVLNVMDHLGIRQRTKEFKEHEEKTKTVFLSNSKWVRAKYSGMFQPLVKNGSEVQKNQLLGYINGPFAQFQKKVTSPITGHIICLNRIPVVYKGDALFHIGKVSEPPA